MANVRLFDRATLSCKWLNFVNRDIHLFIAYRVISRLYFHLPVLFLLFWFQHLSYITITLLLALYGIASTFAGGLAFLLARRLSAKHLVALGECFKSLGLWLLILGTSPTFMPALVVGQSIGGAGFSLALAADSALLNSVASNTSSKTFGTILSRTQSLMFVATLFAGAIGGILFVENIHYPFYFGIVASILSLLTVLLIRDTKPILPELAAEKPARMRLSHENKAWVAFYAVTRAFALSPFIALLPLYFALQKINPALFGLILGLFTLGGFVVALWGRLVFARLGVLSSIWVTCGSLILSLSLFAASALSNTSRSKDFIALVGVILLGMAAGAIRPVVMARLNLKKLSAPQRLTLFARMEQAAGYLSAALLLSFGMLSEITSVTGIYIVMALVLLAILGFFAVWLSRVADSAFKTFKT